MLPSSPHHHQPQDRWKQTGQEGSSSHLALAFASPASACRHLFLSSGRRRRSHDAMLFCFQFQHACGITLLTGTAQAVDGTTALSVQTMSWYFFCLLVCAHNVSRIKREARMSSHRFSTEDVKHAALWRENYILLFFFFKYYSTYSIHIYIKTHYPHLTTRQAHPEWICRSPLSLSTPIPLFL